MQRRTDRTARVLRELQALLGHDCEEAAVERLRTRTRRSRGLAEPLVGLADPRPTLHMLLLEAARAQDVVAVWFLERLGASPFAWLPRGGCALYVAARSFPLPSLRLLLTTRRAPRHVRRALEEARLAGHDDAEEALCAWLGRVACIRPWHDPPRRWPRLVELLLERLRRPGAQGRLDEALVQAVIAGPEEEVAALLDRGASVNAVAGLSHFRLRGSVLRLLQARGARFRPDIQRMLANGHARGDPGQTPGVSALRSPLPASPRRGSR